MAQSMTIKDFLDSYGESMAEKVAVELQVVHEPGKDNDDRLNGILAAMTKKPFPAQAEIIKGSFKSLLTENRAVYTVCECGTGKTLMAIGISYLLHKLKGIKRVLVICPPHLVPKWIDEIKAALPGVKAYNLNGRDVIRRLESIRHQPKPNRLEFHVIGRERVKTGFLWRPAVVVKRDRLFCPRCGQELIDPDGLPLPIFDRNSQGRYKRRYSCPNRVTKWKYNSETGKHERVEVVCGEQLWQPDNSKKQFRKAMPARFIKDKMKGCYGVLVCDEVHQMKNTSGQGYAFGALASTCRYVLGLTGTLAGGYASDVYQLLFRTHAPVMLDDGHRWGNPKAFIERYGVLEKITTVREQDGAITKAKRNTVVKEKPGISPLLLGRMLLSNSVFLRLSDCMDKLQPYEEDVVELAMPPVMEGLYKSFEHEMRQALIMALVQGDNSLLGAYLHALLSYPERMHEGLQVVHPHTGEVVAVGKPLDGVKPKEQELITIIKAELAARRKVLVYIQNSDRTDISPRLVQMLEKDGARVKVLRSGDTEGRARIIDNWVRQGMDVLITNPKKVEVGMDLLDFPSIIFYQVPMSTYTLRQASRRSWRIPQTRPVKVFFLTYAKTMQTRLMQLMADKLMSSLALEGELSDKGLAALSETSDSMAKELAKMLVEKGEDNRNLKDVWAAYRKKEVQVEVNIAQPEAEPEPVPEDEAVPDHLPGDIIRASDEVERIGPKIVRVQFIEYTGKRKKKVTHIEVKEGELDDILKQSDGPVQVCLF